MRTAASYRGARRNVLRAAGNLRHWRNLGAAEQANDCAHLRDRAATCYEARRRVAAAPRSARIVTLIEFWNDRFRTRVVSRILRGLQAQVQASR